MTIDVAPKRGTPPAALSPSFDPWPAVGWLFLAVIVWMIGHGVAPKLKIAHADPAYVPAREAFSRAAWPVLSPLSIRFDEHRGGNVTVFVANAELAELPFPDREPFINTLGRAWCKNLSSDSRWRYVFVPSVRIRDVKTGDALGSYTCFAETWALLVEE